MEILFLVEHETESDRWLPVGFVRGGSPAVLAVAIGDLVAALVPGRFRYLPVAGIGDWRYLELDPDGAVLDTLR